MSPCDEDISESKEEEGVREEEAVEEVREDMGKHLQEKFGEEQSEEHKSSSFLPSIKFNPQCVVQSNSGKVHKFLHIDESIGGNPITIQGQSLVVLPDTISTWVPGTRRQEESNKICRELEHGNITNTGGETRATSEGLIKKINHNHKMMKKFRENCSHCGLRLSSKRNLAKHIKRFHNPSSGMESKKFLDGDFKCLEVGCEEVSFKYRETLVAHNRNKHGAPMLQCLHQGCGMQFSWACSLRQHKKRHKI